MIDEKKYFRYQDYFKSFLGGWSFEDGDQTMTIKTVGEEEMFDKDSGKKKKGLCIHFVEKDLPMVLNVTNATTIAEVVGSDRMKDWIGRKIIVGQSKIKAFGKESYAIRVRNKKPDEKIYTCEECGKTITTAAGKMPSELVEISKRNCGKSLCLACMQAYKAKMDAEKEKEKEADAESDNTAGAIDR